MHAMVQQLLVVQRILCTNCTTGLIKLSALSYSRHFILCVTISRTVASSTISIRMTAISPTTTPTKTPVEIEPVSRLDMNENIP